MSQSAIIKHANEIIDLTDDNDFEAAAPAREWLAEQPTHIILEVLMRAPTVAHLIQAFKTHPKFAELDEEYGHQLFQSALHNQRVTRAQYWEADADVRMKNAEEKASRMARALFRI